MNLLRRKIWDKKYSFCVRMNNLTERRSVINFLNPEERIEVNGELYTMPQYFNNFIKALEKAKN